METVSKWFEVATRGDNSEYVKLNDCAPEWVQKMVKDCHEGHMHNDWIFSKISDCVEAIEDELESNDYRFDDIDSGSIAEQQIDVYFKDRMIWLNTVTNATNYVDEAISWATIIDDFWQLVADGQFEHLKNITEVCYEAMRENLVGVSDESRSNGPRG